MLSSFAEHCCMGEQKAKEKTLKSPSQIITFFRLFVQLGSF